MYHAKNHHRALFDAHNVTVCIEKVVMTANITASMAAVIDHCPFVFDLYRYIVCC